MEPTSTRAVVIVAHGSRAETANDAHRELCAAVAAASGETVIAGFLELADPGVTRAIDEAVAAGHTRVTVLPHFLAPGNHTTRDIPALVDAARAAHPTVTIDVVSHTGDSAGMVDLVLGAIGSPREQPR